MVAPNAGNLLMRFFLYDQIETWAFLRACVCSAWYTRYIYIYIYTRRDVRCDERRAVKMAILIVRTCWKIVRYGCWYEYTWMSDRTWNRACQVSDLPYIFLLDYRPFLNINPRQRVFWELLVSSSFVLLGNSPIKSRWLQSFIPCQRNL